MLSIVFIANARVYANNWLSVNVDIKYRYNSYAHSNCRCNCSGKVQKYLLEYRFEGPKEIDFDIFCMMIIW